MFGEATGSGCTLCKILETIIKDKLLDFLLGKNLISKHQHGFMRKNSTSTHLLECRPLMTGLLVFLVAIILTSFILILVKPLIVLFFPSCQLNLNNLK